MCPAASDIGKVQAFRRESHPTRSRRSELTDRPRARARPRRAAASTDRSYWCASWSHFTPHEVGVGWLVCSLGSDRKRSRPDAKHARNRRSGSVSLPSGLRIQMHKHPQMRCCTNPPMTDGQGSCRLTRQSGLFITMGSLLPACPPLRHARSMGRGGIGVKGGVWQSAGVCVSLQLFAVGNGLLLELGTQVGGHLV